MSERTSERRERVARIEDTIRWTPLSYGWVEKEWGGLDAIYEDGTMRAGNVRIQEHPDHVGLSLVSIHRREEG